MCKGVSSHKLQKKHSGDDFTPKNVKFLIQKKNIV